MTLLPFNVSYLVLTPKRVRLPGQALQSPSSPTKPRIRTTSLRWSTDISSKAKTLRSRVGAKLTSPTKANSVKSDL
ncbi:hypothetical protein B0H34DRAFT_796878 [Crassisporium funariophilum]|nr:hypothetical protein B0H34DRAFT_796878 [Crassisporium funariophilum]